MNVTRRFDALVTAGGWGKRCAAGQPKSLLNAGGKPFVVITVEGLVNAGCRNILVACNRPEWVSTLFKLLENRPEVLIVEDSGYASTIDLARNYISLMESRFIFTYGHAPRPSIHYRKMREFWSPLMASRFAISSKSKPILFGGRFLEPPYLITRELLARSIEREWCEFFIRNSDKIETFDTSDPPEFNYLEELNVYKNYVNSNNCFVTI